MNHPIPNAAPSEAPPRPSVLVVDDEPQVLVALQDILSEEFIVHTTTSPEEALNMIQDHEGIAVVISDQRMPHMTGDELFRNLSANSEAQRILVTGYADLGAVVRAVNDGRIFAYITKPWEPEEVNLRVHQAAEHFRLSKELAYEKQLLSDLLENMPDGIYFKDPQLRFLRANEPVARLLNRRHPEELAGRRLSDLIGDQNGVTATEAEEQRIIRDGTQVVDVIREYGEGGAPQWFSETKAPVRNSAGSVLGLVGISRNVTERVEAENARHRQQQRIARLTRIHSVLSGINSAIVRIPEARPLLDETCRIAIREGEMSLAAVCGVRPEAFESVAFADGEDAPDWLVGKPVETTAERRDPLARAVSTGAPVVVNDVVKEPDTAQRFAERGYRALAVFPLHVAGSVEYVFVLASSQPGYFDGDEVRLLGDLADNISFALDGIAKTQQLDFLAFHDELTGLPNQRLLEDRVTQQLAICRSNKLQLAVVMLDIDRFRQVNESLGRGGGDALLKEVATRLRGRLDAQDSLARIAGNRFAMLITGESDEASVASHVDDLLQEVFKEGFVVGDTEIRVSARVGISLFPSDGDELDALLSNAEAALKRAKTQGRRYVFYAPSMNARVAEKLNLETKLRHALDRQEFVLHYQSKVDLAHGRVVGLEALIRWQPPGEGLVPPGVFIPVLEETGLILDVGRWVLMEAARQYSEWLHAEKSPPRIAVNVSALQLGEPDFLESIREMKEAHPAAAEGVDLEITESVFVDDFDGNVEKLAEARNQGLQVAIDDFGTGYSSLGYLTRLPIDVLKIDRSFVSRMTRDPQDMALVTTVISLGHALNCKVVAEGVEEAQQAQLLRLLKCDQIQGYLIGKPRPANEVVEAFHHKQDFTWGLGR